METGASSEIGSETPTPQFQSVEIKTLGSERAETRLISGRMGYTLTLPGGWWVLDMPKDGDEMLVSSVAEQSELDSWAEAAQRFEERESDVRTEVVARNTEDAAAPVSMTMVFIPRHGLSLEQYLAGTVAELEAIDADIRVEESGIDDELRTDGVPIATLQYTHTDASAGSITYYQTALFDSTADHLLVMTFATPATHFHSKLSAMQGIIADMALRR